MIWLVSQKSGLPFLEQSRAVTVSEDLSSELSQAVTCIKQQMMLMVCKLRESSSLSYLEVHRCSYFSHT